MIVLFVISVISASDMRNDEPRENGLGLLDIMPMIINDPEFHAMTSQEQYMLLEAMYTLVLNHMNKQMLATNQKRSFFFKK